MPALIMPGLCRAGIRVLFHAQAFRRPAAVGIIVTEELERLDIGGIATHESLEETNFHVEIPHFAATKFAVALLGHSAGSISETPGHPSSGSINQRGSARTRSGNWQAVQSAPA